MMKRVKPGAVLEVRVAEQFAYVLYLGRQSEYGDAVLVSPKLYDRASMVASEAFSGGYVTFYPATAAVAQGLVSVVGHLAPPSLPTRFRRPGGISGRRVVSWLIEDAAGTVVRTTLTAEELSLPIASIWNHAFLVQRISENWTPSLEGNNP